MRSLLVVLSAALSASCARPGSISSDPRVCAISLPAAALCRDRGYFYIARTGATQFYCLYTNPDNEPEAIPVAMALGRE